MRKLLILTLCAGVLAVSAQAQDPGVPDTVKIVGDELIVGQSVPVELVLVNDEEIGLFSIPLVIMTEGGGFAAFDSAVFVNRMADPTVLSWRFVPTDVDSLSPDRLCLAALQGIGSNVLPVGSDAIARLYFTGISTGNFSIDASFMPPANHFLLETAEDELIDKPDFVAPMFTVVVAPEPPVFTAMESVWRVVAGTTVNFEVDATSPGGGPVTVELAEFGEYDAGTAPINAPTFTGSSPSTFDWVTTAGDVGVWKAVFSGCDGEPLCTEAVVEIQVVESGDYLTAFNLTETADVVSSLGLSFGNFDSDPDPELVSGGSLVGGTASIAIYDFDDGSGMFTEAFAINDQPSPYVGARAGYVTNDGLLDVVGVTPMGGADRDIHVLENLGESVLEPLTVSDVTCGLRSAVLLEMTGDQYLDYVAADFDDLTVFASTDQHFFSVASTIPEAANALNVNAADFDGDGYNDLAVGTSLGVQIYLNDGAGNFSAGAFYNQTYGATDIEVTNGSSDFNNDNIYDLCVSTPSVGATYSEITVYLGYGDGTFDQRPIKTVVGYVLGNCVADFNLDNQLDIAYINGGEAKVGILFGDGTGNFPNEIRYDLPHKYPAYIACTDVNLDGDVDIAVAGIDAGDMDVPKFFVLENQLDPVGFTVAQMVTEGLNNVSVQLTSSSGRVINSVRNLMPAAGFYTRNIDDNAEIDEFVEICALESGAYTVDAMPRPNLAVGDPFTLEFKVGETCYRLAKDVPMPETGLQFEIYPNGGAPVTPAPGAYCTDDPMVFQWAGTGDFTIQIANDIGFTDLVVNTTVSGNSFEMPSVDAPADTITYYWRVKPVTQGEFDAFYPVSVPGGSTGVAGNSDNLPAEYGLSQNYPNPFNPNTEIRLALPVGCHVKLDIYNIAGQRVRTLADSEYPAGEHVIVWDGKDARGKAVASGIYLFQARADGFTATRKMALVR